MNSKITGCFFKFILPLLFSSTTHASTEFDPCTDIVIDQSTNIAYGAHGAPFDGKFTCYRDTENKKPTIRREFKNGVATGNHFCFDKNGSPEWVIVYLNGKRWKMDLFANRFTKPKNSNLAHNYSFTACDASEWTKDWCQKADFKDCLPE
jgi:hypothetical protein